MTIEELRQDIKNAQSVKINKIANAYGFYSYQYHNGKKWQIGTFKTYEDAITFFYTEGLTEEEHLTKAIILKRN